MSQHDLTPLPGSERALPGDARQTGTGNPDEQVTVTVQLRGRADTERDAAVQALAAQADRPLTRAQFAQRFGADPADVEAVERFAAGHGLTVVRVDLPASTLTLTGPRAAMAAAFGVELLDVETGAFSFRGRSGPVHVPSDLQGVVQGVFGLDDRPQARPHFVVGAPATDGPGPVGPAVARAGFSPRVVADLYGIDAGDAAAGEAIAIIELGGGYRPAEVATYFDQLGLPRPVVRAVSVDGAHNKPSTDPSGADGEVLLDIEVTGAVAPGARLVVYFAPNTSAGFLDAVNAAVHDQLNAPSVISISWGGPEVGWTTAAMRAMDAAFANAALMGVTVTVASGDDGSDDRVGDGHAHVDFPASSPHALGCGGTRITEGTGGTLAAEIAWGGPQAHGASGGGYSVAFARPAWQPVDGGTGRGVPDVAGNADPASGYTVLVDGSWTVIGGTSAVAPLWAGILACANARAGRPAGLVNPRLYAAPAAGAVRDITQGTNGAYQAGTGWDPVTGLGSPHGPQVLDVLAAPSSSAT